MSLSILFITLLLCCFAGGINLRNQLNTDSSAVFILGFPLGLAVLALFCWLTLFISALLPLPNILLYTLPPLLTLYLLLHSIKTPISNFYIGRHSVALLTIISLILSPFAIHAYQAAIHPSIDHDISVYLGYSSEILDLYKQGELGLRWQEQTTFKHPHSNIYPATLVWAAALQGSIQFGSDILPKTIPLFFSLILLMSLLAFCYEKARSAGLIVGAILMYAIPYQSYLITALSIDGFYLITVPTLTYLILKAENNYTTAFLITFLATAHSLGIIWASYAIGLAIISLIINKRYSETLKTIVPLAIALPLIYICHKMTLDNGFAYPFYDDPGLKEQLFSEESPWNKQHQFIPWVQESLQSFIQLVPLLLALIVFQLSTNVNKNIKILKDNIFPLSLMALILMLYVSSITPGIERIGNSFASNFRYAFAIKLFIIMALIVSIKKLIQRKRELGGLLLIISFFLAYKQLQLNNNIAKYQYHDYESQGAISLTQLCSNLNHRKPIFIDSIPVNYICGTSYTYTFSLQGRDALNNEHFRNSGGILITRHPKLWGHAEQYNIGQQLTIKSAAYNYAGYEFRAKYP